MCTLPSTEESEQFAWVQVPVAVKGDSSTCLRQPTIVVLLVTEPLFVLFNTQRLNKGELG